MPPLRNGMGGASRRPRPTGVMVHGGRAATRGRPYGQIGTFQGGRVRTPAPTKYGELSGLSVGAGHWPARRRPLAAHLIRPLRGHLPLKGKAFRRLIAAPTVHRKPVGAHSMRPPEFAPVPLVRKRQARERNRTSPNFCKPRPQWAGRNRRPPLRFCAPEGFCPPQGVTPVNGGPGKGDYEHKVLIWSRPRGRFGYFAAMGKVTRRL